MRAALLVFVLSFCSASACSAETMPVRAARSCGHIHAGGARLKVSIQRGKVKCHTARHVLKRFMNGGGKKHGGGSNATTYWTIGHWRCGYGAGGGACIRHGHNYKTARDFISAQT
jgi:hypothetical protein